MILMPAIFARRFIAGLPSLQKLTFSACSYSFCALINIFFDIFIVPNVDTVITVTIGAAVAVIIMIVITTANIATHRRRDRRRRHRHRRRHQT